MTGLMSRHPLTLAHSAVGTISLLRRDLGVGSTVHYTQTARALSSSTAQPMH